MTYAEMYDQLTINKGKLAEVKYAVNVVLRGKTRYQAVEKLTNVPWWFIGIIHVMEGGGKFTRHLHNGDPLSARTVNVPKGRPKIGNPPFTWEDSAVDALEYMKFKNLPDWDIQNTLDRFEKYNGLGYKKKGVPSPYLWSFSQFYSKGKYVVDGKYDPDFVSKQPGVATIMKLLEI